MFLFEGLLVSARSLGVLQLISGRKRSGVQGLEGLEGLEKHPDGNKVSTMGCMKNLGRTMGRSRLAGPLVAIKKS